MSKKTYPLLALTLIAVSGFAAADDCKPASGAKCYPDDCCRVYCLGPENTLASAPVNPVTCNGDVTLTGAVFYWNAHQDGMEYAIDNESFASREDFHFLINADYKNPEFKWRFGFKLGLGYNSPCDGWDVGVVWTNYTGKASSHNSAEPDVWVPSGTDIGSHVLLPLWSNYDARFGNTTQLGAFDIEAHWKLDLNIVDFELGREFWNSKRVSLRPHFGLRVASLNQFFTIQHKGGSWTDFPTNLQIGLVKLQNDFFGVGVRGGFDTVWNLGCGFGVFGNLAASLVYGEFSVKHDESVRRAIEPYDKTKILEVKNHFRATRLMTDWILGIQYQTVFCECKYELVASLGWEHHFFIDQNQMWQIPRVQDPGSTLTHENIYHQRRGDLSTQGWTIKLQFAF